MPTIYEILGMKFHFYSGDHEPAHIHIKKGSKKAKILIEPEISVMYNHGLTQSELQDAMKVVKSLRDFFMDAWKNREK